MSNTYRICVSGFAILLLVGVLPTIAQDLAPISTVQIPEVIRDATGTVLWVSAKHVTPANVEDLLGEARASELTARARSLSSKEGRRPSDPDWCDESNMTISETGTELLVFPSDYAERSRLLVVGRVGASDVGFYEGEVVTLVELEATTALPPEQAPEGRTFLVHRNARVVFGGAAFCAETHPKVLNFEGAQILAFVGRHVPEIRSGIIEVSPRWYVLATADGRIRAEGISKEIPIPDDLEAFAHELVAEAGGLGR